MERLIKVLRLAETGSSSSELSVAEAGRLIDESLARGNVVFDKDRGRVIDEITDEVREIVVMQLVAGG